MQKVFEVKYECSTPNCGNTQTILYWPDEAILPATCCVRCKAGFNTELSYQGMANKHIGMLPINAAA